MDISVVIPVFNRLTLTKRALDSVLNQSVLPKEIIVVDDGSSDDICSLSCKYPDVKFISYEHNHGVSYARNIGIKNSTCNWIAFLDSDDVWYKNKLEEQISFHMQNTDIKISQTQEIWVRNGKTINQPKSQNKLHSDLFIPSLERCLITPSSVLIHKAIFEDVGVFDESMEVCEDYDLWLRISRKYKIGLVNQELITKYAGHDDQLSFKHWGMDRFRVIALEKHINDEKYKEIIKKVLLKKYHILINGATKRNNVAVVREYQDKLNTMLDIF